MNTYSFIFYFPFLKLFYNVLGLYTIPIDDHALVRGHAVFDTSTVVQGNLYRHRVHIDRFFESAEKANLNLNFLLEKKKSKDDNEKDTMTTTTTTSCRQLLKGF